MARPRGSKNKSVNLTEDDVRKLASEMVTIQVNQLVQQINAALQNQMDETVKGLNQVHDIIMKKINGTTDEISVVEVEAVQPSEN